MPGVDQPVRFSRSEGRRHDKDRRPAIADKPITDLGEFRQRRTLTPVWWQQFRGNRNSRDAVWNLSRDRDKVLRRIIRVEMYEIFDDRQREMLGRVRKTCTYGRPATTKSIRALPIERFLRVRLAQDSVDASQLTPPYAMRPSTFSTARAPSSVSINWSGVLLPRARFGRRSQRKAVWSSPR